MPQYDAQLVRGTNILGTSEQLATEDTQSDISAKLDPATDIETQDLITVGTTAVEITFMNTKGIVVLYSADTNSGNIFIGKSDVENNGNKMFAMLTPGQARAFPYDDSVNALYARSNTFNQKLSASLYLGSGQITFDGFDGRTIGLLGYLVNINWNMSAVVSQFQNSEYVNTQEVLVPGGIDFIKDNNSKGSVKVRKSSNYRTDIINSGGDWYGCNGRDLATGGGQVVIDISRQNLDHTYRALESVKFIMSNDVSSPETGAIKITVIGWDAEIGAYIPKAFTTLDISPSKLTDKDTYICGVTPTVMAWNKDDSRFGFIVISDIGGTFGSTATNIEVLLEDYSFTQVS